MTEIDERAGSIRSFSSDDDTHMTLYEAMNSIHSFRHKKSSANVRNMRGSYLTDNQPLKEEEKRIKGYTTKELISMVRKAEIRRD